jgi:XTP/dITP diphosphohydrolase
MDRIQKLLLNLKDVPKEKRSAKFVCSICCVYPNGDIVTAHGECAGTIGFEPQGSDGFGYDPIFFVNGKSFAQLTAEEKDKISHRGRALKEFAAQLQQIKEQNQ